MPSRICRDTQDMSYRLTASASRKERFTLVGVLGMLRTTVQEAGTHPRIIEIVVPARMEMRSLPSSAFDMPGAKSSDSAS